MPGRHARDADGSPGSPVADDRGAGIPNAAGDFAGGWLETTGGVLFVRRAGPVDRVASPAEPSRPPLLFVHGLGGDSLDWAELAGVLRANDPTQALIAIDLPGFGFSLPPADGDFSLDAHGRAIAGCIEALDCGPVHLVANSMGGSIATRLAARRRELLASLTLISPALPDPLPPCGSWQLLPAALPAIGPRLVSAGLRADPEWVVQHAIRLCFGNPNRIDDTRRRLLFDIVRRRAGTAHGVDAYCASLRSLIASYGRRRLWADAAAVDVPTLLVYGGRDRLVSPRSAYRALRAFPHARLVFLPDAGHVPHLEAPEVVAGALMAFLRGAPVVAGAGRPAPPAGMVAAHATVDVGATGPTLRDERTVS